MAQAFNKKVKPQHFQKGDLVLRKVLPNVRDAKRKFAPNYEGPYIVKKILTSRALILSQMNGLDLKGPVNSDIVKMYYA